MMHNQTTLNHCVLMVMSSSTGISMFTMHVFPGPWKNVKVGGEKDPQLFVHDREK